jgi:hypothetical protein
VGAGEGLVGCVDLGVAHQGPLVHKGLAARVAPAADQFKNLIVVETGHMCCPVPEYRVPLLTIVIL